MSIIKDSKTIKEANLQKTPRYDTLQKTETSFIRDDIEAPKRVDSRLTVNNFIAPRLGASVEPASPSFPKNVRSQILDKQNMKKKINDSKELKKPIKSSRKNKEPNPIKNQPPDANQ